MLKIDINNTFLNIVRPSLIHAKWIHKIQYTKPPQGVGDEKTCQNLYQKKAVSVSRPRPNQGRTSMFIFIVLSGNRRKAFLSSILMPSAPTFP